MPETVIDCNAERYSIIKAIAEVEIDFKTTNVCGDWRTSERIILRIRNKMEQDLETKENSMIWSSRVNYIIGSI